MTRGGGTNSNGIMMDDSLVDPPHKVMTTASEVDSRDEDEEDDRSFMSKRSLRTPDRLHGLHGHGGHLHDDHDTGAEEEALVRRSASGVFRYSEESGFSNEPPFLHDHNKEGDYDESTNTYDGYPKDPFSG